MNKFANSFGQGRVYGANGAAAYNTSGSELVDFFYLAGSARNVPLSQLIAQFDAAIKEDCQLAMKALFWLRDVRGGAGERQAFRDLYAHVDQKYPSYVTRTLHLVPEYGRWDDMWNTVRNKTNRQHMRSLIETALCVQSDDYGLLCKWLPRQGSFAAEMREHMKLTPRNWRKMLVNGSKTVEQKMCAKQWDSIDHSHNPSLAAARYTNAFNRHSVNGDDKGCFAQYKEDLKSGKTTINAGAIFPHEIAKNAIRNVDPIIVEAQWNAMPNFMEESTERILPMIDVSGSMSCAVGGNPNMNCMDVAVGLGAYVALKQPGEFNGMYLTFQSTPIMMRADPSQGIVNMINTIYSSPWGGSTDLQAAFKIVLDHGVQNNVPPDQMPTMIMILSDMQMNEAENVGYNDNAINQTALEMIQTMYESAGYKMPKLVFWNLNNEYGTTEAGLQSPNVMLVSGFSPAILKAITNNTEMPEVPTPYDLVMQVLNSPRYEAIKL